MSFPYVSMIFIAILDWPAEPSLRVVKLQANLRLGFCTEMTKKIRFFNQIIFQLFPSKQSRAAARNLQSIPRSLNQRSYRENIALSTICCCYENFKFRFSFFGINTNAEFEKDVFYAKFILWPAVRLRCL